MRPKCLLIDKHTEFTGELAVNLLYIDTMDCRLGTTDTCTLRVIVPAVTLISADKGIDREKN